MGGVSGLYSWMNSETFQVAGEIIPRIETDKKIVALTFDDGPTEYTDEILQVLQEKDVVATFYLIGENIEKEQDNAKKIVAAGHEVGNHSYTHQRMIFKPKDFYASEIISTNNLIRSIGYTGEITFRPPFGKKLISLPLYLDEQNIKTITWDVEPTKALGADASSQRIKEYVIANTKPGSIVLLHPWYGEKNSSRDAVGAIINSLHDQGYTFVTVNTLLKS